MKINEIINNTKVYGLEESIKRSKYPMSVDIEKCSSEITKTVKKLGSCDTGTGHDNFLKGIIVQFDLTYTIKAWTEAERYHFFEFVSSQSTMHRITKFEVAEQCIKYVRRKAIENLEECIADYNADPTPERYLEVVYNVPVGFRLTAGMTTNYQQLKTIYHQRKNHPLPEWRVFCEWCEGLPKFKELCLGE
jgi:hypothetical protein